MIHTEHEYIPEDATDDLHKALTGIGTPGNRTVHYTVAILRSSERHTSSEFTRVLKKRTADEFKLVMQDCLQSIRHLLVPKQAAPDRSQVKKCDVVATAPLRPRPTECETIARPHLQSCIKMLAVAQVVGEEGFH